MQSFPLGMLYTGSSAPGYNTLTPTHVNIVSLSYTSIPKPNLIFEVRGGYNRFLQQFLPQDIGLNPDTAFGLNTLPPDYSSASTWDCRRATWDCRRSPSAGVSARSAPPPATRAAASTPTTSSSEMFRCTKGRHSFKAGYEWRRTFINSFIDSGHRGKLVFATRRLDRFPSVATLDPSDDAAVPPMATARATPIRTAAAPTCWIPGI